MHGIEIFPQNCFDAIYPSVTILVSCQFRAAYWLITTKTLVGVALSWHKVSPFSIAGKVCNTYINTLHFEILFSANALGTPYWLTWCHVSSIWHIVWLRPKLKSWMGRSGHKVSAFSMAGKLCTTYIICVNLVFRQRLTDPILTDVVSRQFRMAYWLITTKLIHMSWGEILTSFLVRLSLFTKSYTGFGIEIFIQNSVLMDDLEKK